MGVMNALAAGTPTAVLTAAAVWMWTSPADPVRRLRRARPHPPLPLRPLLPAHSSAGGNHLRESGSGGTGRPGAGAGADQSADTPGWYLGRRTLTFVPAPRPVSTTRPYSSP